MKSRPAQRPFVAVAADSRIAVKPGYHGPVFEDTPAGAAATIRVTPRAGRTAFAGERDGILHVKLAAAPVEGAANDALVALVAGTFRVPRRDVAVVAGERSRTKRVVVAGRSAAALNAVLAPLLGER